MEADRDALLSCGVVVALVDGAQVDDGTAWEIGYACAMGIPVIGFARISACALTATAGWSTP